jgi:hypothetical protein
MRGGQFVHELERPAEGYDVAAYAARYRTLVAGGE